MESNTKRKGIREDKEDVKDIVYNYKTNLCKQWSSNKKCSYYHRCMFAHGEEELLQPEEYCQKIQNIKQKKKRQRLRKRTESNMSNISIVSEVSGTSIENGIKSPLNPKAKEFVLSPIMLSSIMLSPPLPSLKVKNEHCDEYEHYWKIIHNMIMIEQIKTASVVSSPEYVHPPFYYHPYHHPPFYHHPNPYPHPYHHPPFYHPYPYPHPYPHPHPHPHPGF